MIPFHKLLIGTAICFCLGFAVWSFVGFRHTMSDADLALGILFLCAAGLLGVYLKNLDWFLHR
jgi:hypothetical protein